jgi:hypothetical protein
MIRTYLSLAVVLVAGLAFTSGCQSMGGAPAASTAPQKAVVITTGQGATVVYVPSADGKGVERLASSGDVGHCAQCEADVAKYFMTGELTPKCSVCGATRTAVTYQIPTHSVN